MQHQNDTYNCGFVVVTISMISLHYEPALTFPWYNIYTPMLLDQMRTYLLQIIITQTPTTINFSTTIIIPLELTFHSHLSINPPQHSHPDSTPLIYTRPKISSTIPRLSHHTNVLTQQLSPPCHFLLPTLHNTSYHISHDTVSRETVTYLDMGHQPSTIIYHMNQHL